MNEVEEQAPDASPVVENSEVAEPKREGAEHPETGVDTVEATAGTAGAPGEETSEAAVAAAAPGASAEAQAEATAEPATDEISDAPVDETVEAATEEGETPATDTPSEELMVGEFVVEAAPGPDEDAQLKAIIEAAIYITDEPLAAAQIAAALGRPAEQVNRLLDELTADYNRPEHGLSIREVAGGYKMATKPEHHEAVRNFVKNLKPPLKLSLAALETLAVIAYKQPITAPEIMEIRGVQGAGVLKTLIDRKLIATGGRKQVIGKPILYKTTKEFLVQFGLKDLAELPTLKEFEELGRLALSEPEPQTPPPVKEPEPEPVPEKDPEPEPEPATDPEQNPVTE